MSHPLIGKHIYHVLALKLLKKFKSGYTRWYIYFFILRNCTPIKIEEPPLKVRVPTVELCSIPQVVNAYLFCTLYILQHSKIIIVIWSLVVISLDRIAFVYAYQMRIEIISNSYLVTEFVCLALLNVVVNLFISFDVSCLFNVKEQHTHGACVTYSMSKILYCYIVCTQSIDILFSFHYSLW